MDVWDIANKDGYLEKGCFRWGFFPGAAEGALQMVAFPFVSASPAS